MKINQKCADHLLRSQMALDPHTSIRVNHKSHSQNAFLHSIVLLSIVFLFKYVLDCHVFLLLKNASLSPFFYSAVLHFTFLTAKIRCVKRPLMKPDGRIRGGSERVFFAFQCAAFPLFFYVNMR